MHQPTVSKLRVLNPLPGGAPYIGSKRAIRLQKNGRLSILECGQIVEFAKSKAREVQVESHRLAELGYKRAAHSGFVERKCLRHIPLIGPDAYLKCIS